MVECQLPKLDVVGSSPISRSIFSTTWEESKIKRYSVYSVFFLKSAERPVSRLSTLLWIAGFIIESPRIRGASLHRSSVVHR